MVPAAGGGKRSRRAYETAVGTSWDRQRNALSSLTYVAEQAGDSIATLARHHAWTMRELETKPRVPAAKAVQQARDEVRGTH
jgi:hypothetical protein